MRSKILLAFSLLIFLFTISQVSANFPIGHYYPLYESLKTPHDSVYYKACKENSRLCMAGTMLPDITVFDYYNLFRRYKLSHTPALCRDLLSKAITQDEIACAVGGCQHQQVDLVSHTIMIPYSITHVYLQNVILHPFREQKLDVFIEENNPEINFDELVSREDFEICVPLFVITYHNVDK